MSDFDVWWEKQGVWPSEYTAACSAWQAAQKAERERIMKALDAALMLRGGIPSEALLLARAAIDKYEGEK